MAHPLKDRRVLISAGPMRAPVDPVRYLQNRSSGKMGLAVALAAQEAGAQVHVLLGPVEAPVAERFRTFAVTRYETAAQYGDSLRRLFPECEVFLSLAAVLDFQPTPRDRKIARNELGNRLELEIEPIPDFAAWAGANKKSHQTLIAFAAETGTTEQILERAERKRAQKNADAIVANPVTSELGPDADRNELWILRPPLPAQHLGPAPKADLGPQLIDKLFPLDA